MAYKKPNRVRMSITGTPGTGDVALNVATSGYQTFTNGGLADADTFPYSIEDGSSWELGIGTYHSSGPSFTRTTVRASSAGGTTKISATSNAIVYSSIQGEDVTAGVSTLDALSDVNVTEGAGIDGKLLKWDNGTSKWIASTPATIPSTLAALTGDVNISSPANGELLTYDTGSSKWKNVAAAGGGGGPGGTMTPPTAAALAAVTNLGSSVLTTRSSGVLVPNLHIKPLSSSNSTLYCALQAAPVGSFSLVVRVRAIAYNISGGWYGAGPVIHNSSGTLSVYMMRLIGSWATYVTKWTGGFTSVAFSGGQTFEDEDMFLHIDYDGTNYLFGASRNGKDAVFLFSEAVATFIGAITHVGIGWSGAYGSTTGPEFDYEHFFAGTRGSGGL